MRDSTEGRLHAHLMMTATTAHAAQYLHGASQGPQRRREGAGGGRTRGRKVKVAVVVKVSAFLKLFREFLGFVVVNI